MISKGILEVFFLGTFLKKGSKPLFFVDPFVKGSTPPKLSQKRVLDTLIRKHQQSASFFCVVRGKFLRLRVCGAEFVSADARPVASAEASHALNAAIARLPAGVGRLLGQ